jgi:hypothetical protein
MQIDARKLGLISSYGCIELHLKWLEHVVRAGT